MISVTDGRVLGPMIEMEAPTPDQYPLSGNALLLGCNQSTNRDPIMHLEATEIDDSILTLKEQRLARIVHPTHGRGVTKYRHVVGETLGLEADELAVLGVLLLRGPQTSGELRTRTERQHPFSSVNEVDDTLARLAARDEPLAVHLERQPGQKEARWQQLLAEEAPRPELRAGHSSTSEREPGLRDRVEELEQRVVRLETALADLLGEV